MSKSCNVPMSEYLELHTVPFVGMSDQMDRAFSTLQIDGMKSVDHEDTEFNNDYSVDPLADPRLDRMDLYNMVDSQDRDKIMNASDSFVAGPADAVDLESSSTSSDSQSESGSGE